MNRSNQKVDDTKVYLCTLVEISGDQGTHSVKSGAPEPDGRTDPLRATNDIVIS